MAAAVAVLQAKITSFTSSLSKNLTDLRVKLIISSLVRLPYGICALSPIKMVDSLGSFSITFLAIDRPPRPESSSPIGRLSMIKNLLLRKKLFSTPTSLR